MVSQAIAHGRTSVIPLVAGVLAGDFTAMTLSLLAVVRAVGRETGGWAWPALAAAAVVLALSTSIGVFIGALAGYLGGRIDEILMRITDMFLAFPAMVLAMVIASALGPSL